MKYTLDSLELRIRALQEKHKNKEILVNSVEKKLFELQHNKVLQDEITTPESNIYYFGVVCSGSNLGGLDVHVNRFKFFHLSANQQENLFFQFLVHEINYPLQGSFIGHEIIVKSK